MDMEELLETISDKGRSEQVVAIAKAILEEKGKQSAESVMLGKDVYSEYLKKTEKGQADVIPKNTFIQYLSVASKSEGTGIFSKGKKQGYYLSQEPEEVPVVVEEPSVATEPLVRGEEVLYPYFRDWLASKGYKARIIFERKKNGKWGNPDVLGVKFSNILGRVQEELVSIECKPNLTEWQKYIFEAVAHKRFADRAYFAFAYQEDAAQKVLPEMIRYAEYYGIGILLLELPKPLYENLLKGISVGDEEIEVQEIYPARYRPPILETRVEFFKKISTTSVTELYEFITSEK